MNEVLHCLLTRRSVKKYLSQPVEKEKLDAVLEAGTYAACGMGRQAGKIVVLQNPDDIAQLEKMNASILGNPDAHPFYGAPVVCVVFADTNVNTWVEDGSLVIGNMMAAAHSLGLGSCWIQGRNREAADGSSSEEYLRELLHFPQRLRLEAILSLGMPAATPAPHSLEELKTEKVHEEAMDAHLLVNVRYTLKPGTREEFLKKFEEIEAAPCSRKEPGNLRYDYFCPEDDADAMCLIEEWTDTEAQKIHGATPHYQKLAALKKEYVLHMDLVKTYIDSIPPAVTSE